MPAETRLVLVGAGHAHLHLIRHADRLRESGYRITLLAPAVFDYSGTATAIAAGTRHPADGRIDVAALARTERVEHRCVRVTGIDPATRTVTTDDGTRTGWDVLSVNVGSVARSPGGVNDDHVIGIKPLADLARLRDRLAAPPTGRGHHVTVVGAGASGIELAAQLAARADVDRVRLLETGPRIGASLPAAAAVRVAHVLEQRDVRLRAGIELEEIDADAVTLADGTRLPHDIVVLATGLAPPPLATRPPLGGGDGLPIRATLQHRDHDDVYAAGDCADFLPVPLPRLGVHGVRQGPVLLAALRARADGTEPPVYEPPEHPLSILDLGDGLALAVRGRGWWLGRASHQLKRLIDRRWLAGYRV